MVNTSPYCYNEQKPCIKWIQKIFKDCLCNTSDEISFSFGMVSLVCWAVAEIPQIFTNFINKSSDGVSLTFLLAWVIGDIFNLVGCLLEPATLPTQYYTALLYTISTIVLVLQTIYYDYIYILWNGKKKQGDSRIFKDEEVTKPLNPKSDDSSTPIHSAPVRVSGRNDVYYTSARFMAGSGTPPYVSYLRPAKSGPPAMENIDSSTDEEDETHEGSPKKTYSKPRRIPHSVGYGTFLTTSAGLAFQAKALVEGHTGLYGRRLLLDAQMNSSSTAFGECLGWMMAAIYMGGRVPQICLNIKRRSVEGLNPLMFIFALTANVTYVGSILVRSTEWAKIKPNLPWLLDAIVCVVLDLFIILQFVYYTFMQKKSKDQDYGDYVEPEKSNLP